MEHKQKTAIYVRCSTLLGQDINNQLVPLRALAQQRGFHVVEEYYDEGMSGVRERRPGLDGLLRDAYLQKFEVVLVAAIDRIGRDVRHLLNLIHELDKLNVVLISQRESIDFGSPLGRATLIILGAIGQMEREATKERIRIALATKKLAAAQTGSGWRCGRPNAADEKLVSEILDLHRLGHSIRGIQKMLGKKIGHSTIGRIIKTSIEAKLLFI